MSQNDPESPFSFQVLEPATKQATYFLFARNKGIALPFMKEKRKGA